MDLSPLDEIIVENRDPALKQDHQSWLMWWLVENRPEGMAQWWYVIDEKSKTLGGTSNTYIDTGDFGKPILNNWFIVSKNYKTLGGTSGYGNYFVVSQSSDDDWVSGRHLGQQERGELMARLTKGFRDETVGIKVDYQFFLENYGWYLAERPNEDNHVGLFYRGNNSASREIVVKTTTDLMPNGVTKIGKMTHNDMNLDTIRFLYEEDSWVLPTKVSSVLNWSRFPTVFLE